MSRTARLAQSVLVLFGVVCAVVSASVYAQPDPFEPDAQALISTFGVGMGVLVVALAVWGLDGRDPWAWAALWVLPAFFVAHVALLGTWLPDGVFAAVAVAALLVTRPSRVPA